MKRPFCAPTARGDPWVERRRAGLDRLASTLRAQYSRSIAWGDTIRESFSDLRFTDVSRVPFPFVRVMRDKFSVCSVVTASSGPTPPDLDGHWTIDVSGSYGVNVAGFDRYKNWIELGWHR
jgi:glutamate-1-semialdehyde 2,1-aminomutase